MSRNFLISDLHFGHGGVSEKFRKQFSSDEEHDETIFENIMACSGKRNSLWVLGDACFKEEHYGKFARMVEEFQWVNVILGNHDPKSFGPYLASIGARVHGFTKRWGFWLSHCPIHPQELYRGKNIHGHVHSNTIPDSRYFNVSCENVGYKPISLKEVVERMSE